MTARRLPRRQAVLGRHDEHEVLVEQGSGDEVGGGDRQVDDGNVELAVGEQRLETRGRGVDHEHLHLGMALAHHLEKARRQPPGGGADDADAYGATDLAPDGGDVGDERVELGADAPGAIGYCGALLGQPAGAAVDERRAELALEAGNMRGDVRLHGVQGGGRGGEAAVVGHRHQCRQLSQVHHC